MIMIPQITPTGPKTRLFASMGLAGALLAAGWLVAPKAWAGHVTRGQQAVAQQATRLASDARRALDMKKPARAIEAAERAVAAVPTSADYRFLLAEAYLSAGRFQSAAAAYQDCLTLEPDRAKAGFKLALTQIALGETARARDLLVAHQSALAVSDFGLALALAGDTDMGVRALEDAVRAGEDNAKLRQNLALSYALAGRWDAARTQAAVDLASDQIPQRMADWARFAQPGQGLAQISGLLGIQPQKDSGLPAALALQATPGHRSAQELAALPKTAAPAAIPDSPPALVTVSRDPAPVAIPAAVARFEAPPEVKDPVRVRIEKAAIRVPESADRSARSHAGPPAVRAGKGFVVQIGAFRTGRSVAVAWTKSMGRWPILRRFDARQARQEEGVYRLSVGGFSTRADANRLCQSLRSSGARCFTRPQNKLDIVRWAAVKDRPLRQLALR